MKNAHRTLNAVAMALCLAFAGASANAQSRAAEVGPILTEEQIETRFDAAMERCNNMSGEQEDLCEKEAETEREKARADAKLHERASEAQREAQEKKMEAEYELGKERCDAMSGNEARTCRADLDAKFNRN